MRGKKLSQLELKMRAMTKRPRTGTAAYMRWYKARRALGKSTRMLSQAELLRRNTK